MKSIKAKNYLILNAFPLSLYCAYNPFDRLKTEVTKMYMVFGIVMEERSLKEIHHSGRMTRQQGNET